MRRGLALGKALGPMAINAQNLQTPVTSPNNVQIRPDLPRSCKLTLRNHTCGNFSDTSCLKPKKSKGSRGHTFTVCIRTENQDQASFRPSAPREVSGLPELALGHLCYRLTGVPPQSNSPPDPWTSHQKRGTNVTTPTFAISQECAFENPKKSQGAGFAVQQTIYALQLVYYDITHSAIPHTSS